MQKKKGGGGGAHGGSWVISFADLMSLLMAFFVMLLSFSSTEPEKYTQVTGSVQDAFGITTSQSLAGMIERNGNPERDFAKSVSPENTDAETEFSNVNSDNNNAQGHQDDTSSREPTSSERSAMFSLAAATLKQAWQDLPEITAISDNLLVEETKDGINIVISDQNGRAMFPEASKYPYELTRKAIAAMAPSLAKLPNQIRVSGHTAAGTIYSNPRYGAWELSFDRANMTRQILAEFGVPDTRFEGVAGLAESDPFFPNDPYLAANERVSILLLYENPPVPAGLSF
jgi:chemotaxis protein MotB